MHQSLVLGALRRLALGASALVAAALFAPPAGAFELTTTRSGHDVAWAPTSVELAIEPSLIAAIYAATDAVNDSARAWSGINGAPALHIVRGDGHDAIGDHQRSAIFYAPAGAGGSGYAPVGHALAVTILSYDETTGQITDADIVVNGKYAFAVLAPQARPERASVPVANDSQTSLSAAAGTMLEGGAFDLQHVIAHEMGHFLGLRDETNDQGALMYLFTAPHDASRRAPSSDDIAAVKALYGAPRGHGCGGATVSRSPPPSRASTHAAIGAFLLVAWLLAYRRPTLRAAIAAGAAVCLVLATPIVARGDRAPAAHARARVVRAETDTRSTEGALWTTHLALAIDECRIAHCPRPGDVVLWGGTRDGVTQQVGEAPPPTRGDVLDIDFADGVALPVRFTRALGPASASAR